MINAKGLRIDGTRQVHLIHRNFDTPTSFLELTRSIA